MTTCPYTLSADNDSAFLKFLPMLNANVTDSDLLQAVACNGLYSDSCIAICPNQDLAGIGVRVAFYFQSVLTALLVIFSPADAVPTAWAGTLLTTALVVAAIVQKATGQLTLHHATLVLNFATLSCISSLAVVPTLSIWRLKPEAYYREEQARHALTSMDDDHVRHEVNRIFEASVRVKPKQVAAAQQRGRVILSLAILVQVVMQWAWGIYLFVSPAYSQKECNGNTTLILFLTPFSTSSINSFDNNGIRFVVWPLWLLFCLGITLALTIILAVSSPERANPDSSTGTGISTRGSHNTPAWRWVQDVIWDSLPPLRDKKKQFIFWTNIGSFILWALFVAASEWQKVSNCIFSGEDDFGGLGQITAVFVAITPLWSLVVALYKYPSLRRKRKRRQEAAARPAGTPAAPSPTSPSGPSPASDDPSRPMPPPTHAPPLQSILARRRGHAATGSDAAPLLARESAEGFEMRPVGASAYLPVPASPESPLARRPSGPRERPWRGVARVPS